MAYNFEIKALSSLEKCFLDDQLSEKNEHTEFTVFRGQPLAYQIGVIRRDEVPYKTRFEVRLRGEIADFATVRQVISMPSHYPCIATTCDQNYLRNKPGLFPDMLRPLHYRGQIVLPAHMLQALWIEVDLPAALSSGKHSLTVELYNPFTGEFCAEKTVTVRLLDMELPAQRLIHTEWFYTDCLAEYYHVRAFSERHWRIIEAFLRTAVRNGINMILTPIFTPEIDTYVGGERLTTQLLGITVVGKDHYEFDFSLVERWVDLCLSVGVKYFEIPHFFTQWGSENAPKFIATVNGKKKRIFGWETDACGEKYKTFLGQMIPALIAFLEKKGVAKNTFFHISDEPHLKHMEQYLRCKNILEPLVGGLPIIDALSDFEFYETGVLKKPVPHIQKIVPFLDRNVEGLWTYYCGDSGKNGSGRQLAMPLARTRILGVQLWLYNIEGFLHWGYNFYNNECSYDRADPFLYTDADFMVPSGDSALVYPGENGVPYESIRINALREAMEDMRLLDLAASRLGRDRVVEIIDELAGERITFVSYPTDADFLLGLRDRLISEIE